MASATLEHPVRARGRPRGSKSRPGSQKPGPKPKLLIPEAKVGQLVGHRTPRRVDLEGSAEGLDLTTFAGRIAHSRLAADLSQEQLGDAINRTRQSILQYERGASFPPIDVIESLARRLGVSATYLAFGEHAVKVKKAEEVVNIDEISYGREGRHISGSIVIPRAMAESFVPEIRGLRVYVLSHNAPLFNLRANDRLFVDTKIDALTIEHDTYVIEIGGEMEIVRYVPTPGKRSLVTFLNPSNTQVEMKAKDLKVLGAVVSTISRH